MASTGAGSSDNAASPQPDLSDIRGDQRVIVCYCTAGATVPRGEKRFTQFTKHPHNRGDLPLPDGGNSFEKELRTNEREIPNGSTVRAVFTKPVTSPDATPYTMIDCIMFDPAIEIRNTLLDAANDAGHQLSFGRY